MHVLLNTISYLQANKDCPRHFLIQCWNKLGSLRPVTLVVSDSTTLWTVACQAPLAIGFSRQEYWRGFPYASPVVFLMLGSGETPLFFVGEGNGTPLQDSCLENSMDGGAWSAAVHGVTKNRTRLSDFPFTFHFHALEKRNGNPLQCSCLENPRDGGAWWAAVYGVTESDMTELT